MYISSTYSLYFPILRTFKHFFLLLYEVLKLLAKKISKYKYTEYSTFKSWELQKLSCSSWMRCRNTVDKVCDYGSMTMVLQQVCETIVMHVCCWIVFSFHLFRLSSMPFSFSIPRVPALVFVFCHFRVIFSLPASHPFFYSIIFS